MYAIPFEIIPLKEDSYHIGLEGLINDQACRILIDTGASKSVLDKEFANGDTSKIQLLSSEDLSSGLGTNTMKVETAILNKLTMGEFVLKDWQIAVIDLSHVNHAYSEAGLAAIHMVLGNDILVKFNASINYQEKLLFLA